MKNKKSTIALALASKVFAFFLALSGDANAFDYSVHSLPLSLLSKYSSLNAFPSVVSAAPNGNLLVQFEYILKGGNPRFSLYITDPTGSSVISQIPIPSDINVLSYRRFYLNDSNHVIGHYQTGVSFSETNGSEIGQPVDNNFYYHDGIIEKLNVPEGYTISNFNNLDQVLGYYTPPPGSCGTHPGGYNLVGQRIFLLSKGVVTQIPTKAPCRNDVIPLGLNNNGIVAGVYNISSNASARAFFFDGTTVTKQLVSVPGQVTADDFGQTRNLLADDGSLAIPYRRVDRNSHPYQFCLTITGSRKCIDSPIPLVDDAWPRFVANGGKTIGSWQTSGDNLTGSSPMGWFIINGSDAQVVDTSSENSTSGPTYPMVRPSIMTTSGTIVGEVLLSIKDIELLVGK